MTDDDINDLIGGHGSQLTPAPAKVREDTPQHEIDAIIKQVGGGKGSFVDAGVLKRPVTRNFLALVFDMDPATVKKRLLTVKPVGFAGSGVQARELYDFKEACSYLVEPKIDLDAYIRSLDPAKLPNHINDMFWKAQRTRLKFLHEAREAWATGDVLAVFGETNMLIKDRVQLWGETMREECKLSDEQMDTFNKMSDALLLDLHKALIAEPEGESPRSFAAPFEDTDEAKVD